jgi:RNA polymerase sigma factor (sigma-70 family)
MTATIALEASSDTDLVLASRQGDREAFGKIVLRYQGMISGLIYSSCGDLSASEDVAQETFLSAWKSLSGLREPQKLPAWLCQIARHRMLDQSRSVNRADARLARAITPQDAAASPRPDEEAMTAEEREVLWRSLSEIAEPYRQTLILYYRQNQSAAEVAAALEISEETVRQRLSRGRQMLREQVAAMLERNLVRSAPQAQFASIVVAALPALVAQSATAVTAGGFAKATTAAKGASLLSLLVMWIGPIVGVLGGIYGTAQSIRSTQTPRERRFVVRMSVVIWIYVLTAMAVLFTLGYFGKKFHWSSRTNLLVQCGFWLGYGLALTSMVLRYKRRHVALRYAEGLSAQPPAPITPLRRFGIVAATTAGSVIWMLFFAIQAGDWVGAAIVAAAMVGVAAWAGVVTREKSAAMTARFFIRHAVALGILTFVMVNWRFHTWLAAMRGISMEEAQGKAPLWAMNLLLVVIWGFILTLMWVTMRGSGRLAEVDPAAKPTEASGENN